MQCAKAFSKTERHQRAQVKGAAPTVSALGDSVYIQDSKCGSEAARAKQSRRRYTFCTLERHKKSTIMVQTRKQDAHATRSHGKVAPVEIKEKETPLSPKRTKNNNGVSEAQLHPKMQGDPCDLRVLDTPPHTAVSCSTPRSMICYRCATPTHPHVLCLSCSTPLSAQAVGGVLLPLLAEEVLHDIHMLRLTRNC